MPDAAATTPSPVREPTIVAPWWMLWAAPAAAIASGAVAVGLGLALGADRASCLVAGGIAAAPAALSPIALAYVRGATVTIFGLAVMGLAMGRILISVGAGAGLYRAMELDRTTFLTVFLTVAGLTLVGEKLAALAVLRPVAFGQGAQAS